MNPRPALLLALTLSLPACGPAAGTTTDAGIPGNHDGSPAIAGLASLTITPTSPTLTVTGTTPATQVFTATGKFTDGHTADVSLQVDWTIDDVGLAEFTADKLTSNVSRGGKSFINASAATAIASTSLTLVLDESTTDPTSTNLPANPASLFTGTADPTRAPQVVYPADGTLVPPNLGKLEIHFTPGAPANTLFQVDFDNDILHVAVFTRCTTVGMGCVYQPTESVWTWIAESNRGGAPVAISVKGTGDTGGGFGASTPVKLSFAFDDIQGGIYYWTTSGATGIMRFDFASTTQTAPESFLAGGSSAVDSVSCVGCHALSRDGSKLVAEVEGRFDGRDVLLDVTHNLPLVPFPTPQKSIFEAWNPSGTQYVGVCGPDGCSTSDDLLLIDGTSGMLLSTIPIGATGAANAADHPDWSPDGNSIVYTQIGATPDSLQRMYRGAIGMVQQSANGWGAPVILVPSVDGKNHYYPSFSPDNSEIVFCESTCASGTTGTDCDADSDPTAHLWMMPPHAGATPFQLTRANTGGITDGTTTSLTNSFPRWSPFVFQRTTDASTKLEWLTFSSTRNLGLRPPPFGGNEESATGAQVWMVAIDPQAAATGADPSYPRLLPAVPGPHDVQSHRSVDDGGPADREPPGSSLIDATSRRGEGSRHHRRGWVGLLSCSPSNTSL